MFFILVSQPHIVLYFSPLRPRGGLHLQAEDGPRPTQRADISWRFRLAWLERLLLAARSACPSLQRCPEEPGQMAGGAGEKDPLIGEDHQPTIASFAERAF